MVYANPDEYHYAMMDMASNLAPATPEESERVTELTADFDTYYRELLTKLILGEADLADWDSYIADMQELGMDELISIMQDRYNRANGK